MQKKSKIKNQKSKIKNQKSKKLRKKQKITKIENVLPFFSLPLSSGISQQ